jgi:hypothetical protein
MCTVPLQPGVNTITIDYYIKYIKYQIYIFTWRHVYLHDSISFNSSWKVNISNKHVTENQNIGFIFNNFLSKLHFLWDDVEKYGTATRATGDNIIKRIRFACWIHKATNTHLEYIILLFRCSNDYTNALYSYVMRSFSVLSVVKEPLQSYRERQIYLL